MLDLDDWPVIGPAQVIGNDLLMRIVIIETDEKQNEEARRYIKLASDMATAVQPAAGMAIKVAQPIVDLLIGLNGNDVAFDHRFALHLRDQKDAPTPLTSNELMYGTYVLMQQEDFLTDSGIASTTPQAGFTPTPSEMRFDTLSNRLYRLLMYKDNSSGENRNDIFDIGYHDVNCDSQGSKADSKESKSPKNNGNGLNMPSSESQANETERNNIPLAHNGTDIEKLKITSLKATSNVTVPSSIVTKDSAENGIHNCETETIKKIGVSSDTPGPFTKFDNMDQAILAAFYQSLRSTQDGDDNIKVIEKATRKPYRTSKSCPIFCKDKYLRRYYFQYPTLVAPSACAVLTQYALHTHLVFSIERWNQNAEGDITSTFATLTNYNTTLMQSVDKTISENARVALVNAASQYANATQVMKFSREGNNEDTKVRSIYSSLCTSSDTINLGLALFADALFMEAGNMAGKRFNNCTEMKDWLGRSTTKATQVESTPAAPAPAHQ